MKNQTDLIVTIVAVLCMLIGVGVCYGTKGEAVKPQPPEQPVTTALQLPATNVVMASSLSGGGGGGGVGGPGGSLSMPAGAGGKRGGLAPAGMAMSGGGPSSPKG